MHLQLELIQDKSFAKILNSGFGSEFRKIEVYGIENTGQHQNCLEICYFSAGIAQLGEQQTEASVCLCSGGPVFNPRSWHFLLPSRSCRNNTVPRYIFAGALRYTNKGGVLNRIIIASRVYYTDSSNDTNLESS